MNISLPRFTLFVMSTIMLSACATIVSDSKYPVAIDTTPSGVEFVITNEDGVAVHSDTTPATVVLKSGAGYFNGETYKVSCDIDDKSVDYILDSELDGWYIGNIIFGGLIGFLIVDPATGSMWKLPDTVNISMDGSTANVVKSDSVEQGFDEDF
jgi:hypothetical protein